MLPHCGWRAPEDDGGEKFGSCVRLGPNLTQCAGKPLEACESAQCMWRQTCLGTPLSCEGRAANVCSQIPFWYCNFVRESSPLRVGLEQRASPD